VGEVDGIRDPSHLILKSTINGMERNKKKEKKLTTT